MKRLSSRTASVRVAAGAHSRPSAWRRSSRALWRAWVVIGWCASLALAAWGLWKLEQRVTAPRADITCHLEWVWDKPSPWFETADGQGVLEEVSRLADLRPDDNIHAPALCERVGQSIRGSPWVADVQRVTKQSDGTVRVRARFREPFTYVDVKGRAYLIDETGVRLPQECATSLVPPQNWLVITGVSKPVPAEGQPWNGDDLKAGVALLRYLKEEELAGRLPYRGWLKAIDVSNFDRRDKPLDGELRVQTISSRGYINWGLPPGAERKTEASARRKVEMLRSLFAAQGQFPDQPFDVRNEMGVTISGKPAETETSRDRR